MNALQQTLLARIRDNHQDGATRLAHLTLDALAEYAQDAKDDTELSSSLLALSEALAQCRPNMVALAALMAHWQSQFDATAGSATTRALAATEATHRWAEQATGASVTRATAALRPMQTLLTHSASSTVSRVLLALAGPELEVMVTESRPGHESRPMATALADAGAQVTLVTDAAAGGLVARAEAVLVGADAILADGSLVNKAGTYPLALAAREAGVPFHVCAEPFKRSSIKPGNFELEQQPGTELEPPRHARIQALNPYFDITPGALITRVH